MEEMEGNMQQVVFPVEDNGVMKMKEVMDMVRRMWTI